MTFHDHKFFHDFPWLWVLCLTTHQHHGGLFRSMTVGTLQSCMNEKISIGTTPFPKFPLHEQAVVPYAGIVGQSLVHMDDNTHRHQNKSDWPVSWRPGLKFSDSEKFSIAQLQVDTVFFESADSCKISPSKIFHQIGSLSYIIDFTTKYSKLWTLFQPVWIFRLLKRKLLSVWKQGWLQFKTSCQHNSIKSWLLTITVNTLENIHTKFHNDQQKPVGDMYIYFRGGDLLWLNHLVIRSKAIFTRVPDSRLSYCPRCPDFGKDTIDLLVFHNETTRLVVLYARRTPKMWGRIWDPDIHNSDMQDG